MARHYDLVEIRDAVDAVLELYEVRRIEELLAPAKGNSRIDKEDLHIILGKAQAAREIKSQLYTQFGLELAG